MTFLSPSKEKFLLKTIIILNQPIAFSVSYMCPHRHIDMNTQTHEYFAMVQFLSVFFREGKNQSSCLMQLKPTIEQLRELFHQKGYRSTIRIRQLASSSISEMENSQESKWIVCKIDGKEGKGNWNIFKWKDQLLFFIVEQTEFPSSSFSVPVFV